MFQQLVRKLRHRKLIRRLSEVDRSIRGNVEIVETAKWHTVSFSREHFHFAGLVHRQQPFDRISNDQITGTIEDQPERTPASVRKNTRLCSVWLQLNDATVFKARVDLSVRIQRNVFGLVSVAQRKFLHRGEASVLLILTSKSWRNWRSPTGRIDRNRREQQISECGDNQNRNDESDFFERH